MKYLKKILTLTILLVAVFSFESYAMSNTNDLYQPSPKDEQKHEDRSLDYRWTWINDDTCVQFKLKEDSTKDEILKRWDMGMLPRWAEYKGQELKRSTRETYSGKWSQSADGVWSFTFDDCTIPVGVTKIDGVLYAFNTYGELKAGYEYYTGFKTEADGLVKADSAEFTQWLTTQYLPECTSHE